MDAIKTPVGTPLQEAMRGFAKQVSRIHKKMPHADFQVDAYLIQNDRFICVSATFPNRVHAVDEAWVPLDIGAEGWNEARRERLVYQFNRVAREQLRLEQFTADWIEAKMREVVHAYH